MKLQVTQIREDEGLRVHYTFPDGEPRLGDDDIAVTGQPELNLTATRNGVIIRLAGQIAAEVEFACDRCLKPVIYPVRPSFDLVYVPAPAAERPPEETELGEDDLDVSVYDGESIDLDDLVREQVELSLPMAKLCGEGCRGLCPECGANLNEEACGCTSQPVDPRWAALKALKSNEE